MSEAGDVPKPAERRSRPDHPDPVAPLGPFPDVRTPADLRCSDVDRERVAEALRQAAGDGRLTLTELEERLDATFKARTYGDLQPITRDLPQGPYPIPGVALAPRWQHRPAPAPAQAPDRAAAPRGLVPAERITSILGDEKRRGRWEVPPRVDITCMLGNVELDFSEAIVRSREVVIQAGVVLGDVTLIVPEGIDVRLEQGANVLGERKMKMREPVTPGGPVYRVRGFVVLGQITVRPPKTKRRSQA
jgi:hypothetical protein